VLAKSSGKKAGVLETDRTLSFYLIMVIEASVVWVLVGECCPIVFEVLIGEFFFIPLVGVE
jgi:hypothetical protein